MRYGASGEPLAAVATPVMSTSSVRWLDIAAFGTGYVISGVDGHQRLVLVFVDANGTLERSITTTVAAVVDPQIATNGGRIIVIGTQDSPLTLREFLFDGEGRLVTSGSVSDSPPHEWAVTSTPSGFAVVTAFTQDTMIERFDTAGNRQGQPASVSLSMTDVDIASDGNDVAVVGTDGGSKLLYAIVDDAGIVRTKDTLAVSDSSLEAPHVVFARGAFRAAYSEKTTVSGNKSTRLFATAFTVERHEPAVVIRDNASPLTPESLATNGTVALLVGESLSAIADQAWAIDNPPASRSHQLSFHPIDQYTPAIAGDGSGYLAVWWEQRIEGLTVNPLTRAILLDAHGLPVMAEPMLIGTSRTAPAVGYGAGLFVVTREDNGALVASRIRTDGSNIDTTPIVVRPPGGALSGPGESSVAWNGETFVIAWNEASAIYAAAMRPDGTVSDAHMISPVVSHPDDPRLKTVFDRPRIAADANRRTLITYRSTTFDQFVSDSGPLDIHVEAVSVDPLAVPVTSRISLSPSAGTSLLQAVAKGAGSDYALLLSDVTGVSATIIHAGQTLSAESPQHIFTWPGGIAEPAVTWNGADYVASWRYNVAPNFWLAPSVPSPSYTATATLDTGGHARDLAVSRSAWDQLPPDGASIAIASNGPGTTLTLTSETLPSGSDRIVAFTSGDFTAPPARPGPPRAARLILGSGRSASTLLWLPGDGEVDGYAIQAGSPDQSLILDIASEDDRSATNTIGQGEFVLSAFNAAGFSEPVAVRLAAPRRRSTAP